MAQQQGNNETTFGYSLANFVLLNRIKYAIGLDECKFFLYGAAPLKQSSVDYFNSLDMPLFNMYGLSETTATATVQYYNDFSSEHAGKCMAGGELKILNPDEEGKGEILLQGRHVMMGYFKNE